MKLFWTKPAARDLQYIKDYIGENSRYYANIFALKLIKHTEIIKDNPKIGRVVPESRNSKIREIIFKNYRIIYLLKRDSIDILTVLHGSRNIDGQEWLDQQ